MADTSAPLSRFTVLDLTRVRSGPTAVRQLADWGANVIKIEAPESVDTGKGMGGARHGPDFQNLHRNKRAITLNLKEDAGRETFLRLARQERGIRIDQAGHLHGPLRQQARALRLPRAGPADTDEQAGNAASAANEFDTKDLSQPPSHKEISPPNATSVDIAAQTLEQWRESRGKEAPRSTGFDTLQATPSRLAPGVTKSNPETTTSDQ